MKATLKQLQKIESLKTDFCLLMVGDYGFYSNGNIGVDCVDSFGEFNTIIDKEGNIV